jgi:aspartyl-tRNA(Asn)/glutamyl-tRNA(Gln) amidotransferase subunit A
VQERFDEAVALLTELGATVTEVSCPHFAYALPAYYLIAPSEASSNLARFDSVRYGLRVGDDGDRSLEEVMSLTRDAGFGPEVKRRIILGTYALSSGYYDAYYGQAQKVRTLITRDFAAAFEQADVLVSPASPGVAFPLGRQARRPARDVPPGPRDDPVEPLRRPGDVAAGRAVRGPAGGAAGHGADDARRPALPGGRHARGALLDRWGGPLLASAPELAVSGG